MAFKRYQRITKIIAAIVIAINVPRTVNNFLALFTECFGGLVYLKYLKERERVDEKRFAIQTNHSVVVEVGSPVVVSMIVVSSTVVDSVVGVVIVVVVVVVVVIASQSRKINL